MAPPEPMAPLGVSAHELLLRGSRVNYSDHHQQPNMYSEQPLSLYPDNSTASGYQDQFKMYGGEEDKVMYSPMYSHLFPENPKKYSSSEPVLDSDILEDDMMFDTRGDSYAMTSDNPDDEEESVDENYKAITDEALGITSSVH